jgi:hypothetical protein
VVAGSGARIAAGAAVPAGTKLQPGEAHGD